MFSETQRSNITLELDNKMSSLWDGLDLIQKKTILDYTLDITLTDNTMSINELKEYNQDIEDAENEIIAGSFITHNAALTQLSKWKL